MFIGKKTDFMYIEPIKTESCSHITLQDFTHKHGIPHIIKTDNARTETGVKWTGHCCQYYIAQKFTESLHLWQNYTEYAI